MDYKEYEKYINERMRIKAENERRIKEKFSECEKWVADNLIDCGIAPLDLLPYPDRK